MKTLSSEIMDDVAPVSASLGSPTRDERAPDSNDVDLHHMQQQWQLQRQQSLVEKGLYSPSIDSRPPRSNNNPPDSNNSISGDMKQNNWISSSPFSQLGTISPGSALSFSPGTFAFSPLRNGKGDDDDEGNLFSPSIFSPSPIKGTVGLKKRDYSSSLDIGGIGSANGIVELQMNDGKVSQPSSARPTANDYMKISHLILPSMHDSLTKTREDNVYTEAYERRNNLENGDEKKSRKRQVESGRRLNLDAVDDFLLGGSGCDGINFLDDIPATAPLHVPGSDVLNVESCRSDDSNGNKSAKSNRKSPGRHNEYFSSPATVLRPSAPPNMSPDMINGTNKGVCNCKRSKCLKLYCDCFKAQQYCNGCDCLDCKNLPSYEEIRQQAIHATKERNSTAFQPKVVMKDEQATHNAGCNCKKSRCVKKYCECFEASVPCSANCKCLNCMNDGNHYHVNKAREKVASLARIPIGTPGKPALDQEKNCEAISITKDAEVFSDKKSQLSTPHQDTQIKTRRSAAKSNSTDGMNNSSAVKKRGEMSAIDKCEDETEVDSKTPTSASSTTKKTTGAASYDTKGNNRSHSKDNNANNKSKSNGHGGHSKKPASVKKRKVKFTNPREPVYEFFGPNNPHTTKLTALRCLDFLEDKDIITMSQVNKLWSIAAMDDALWE